MPHVAVSAVGADRPGIVAAVTGVLAAEGCNLEDTSMTILRGHFAMLLVVAAPEGAEADAIARALAPTAEALELVVSVQHIDDDVPASPEGTAWSVSVYGADRPGIVHEVTSVLAARDANITDLATRMIGGEARPVYVMLFDVTLPAGVDAEDLRRALDDLGGTLGVECSMHAVDADVL